MKEYCLAERNFEGAEEIRFRCGGQSEIVFIDKCVCFDFTADMRFITELLSLLAGQSLYAYEQQIKMGFLTVKGGHRVGFTGKTHISQGKVISMDHFTSLNIRIARQIIGAADGIIGYIRNGRGVYSTLLTSEPAAGKTTALRDIARRLSDGEEGYEPLKCAIIDERGELACCHEGYPMLNCGKRSDIMDNCPRAEGLKMVIRSMSPQVIITDEINSREDMRELMNACRSGVKVICSMHRGAVEEVFCEEFLIASRVFERYIGIKRNAVGIYPTAVYDGALGEVFKWS